MRADRVRALDRPAGAVIFEDVRIFNGTANQLSSPTNVLTVGGVDLALALAERSAVDPKTVVRVACDHQKTQPAFALGVALAALQWMARACCTLGATVSGAVVGRLNSFARAQRALRLLFFTVP